MTELGFDSQANVAIPDVEKDQEPQARLAELVDRVVALRQAVDPTKLDEAFADVERAGTELNPIVEQDGVMKMGRRYRPADRDLFDEAAAAYRSIADRGDRYGVLDPSDSSRFGIVDYSNRGSWFSGVLLTGSIVDSGVRYSLGNSNVATAEIIETMFADNDVLQQIAQERKAFNERKDNPFRMLYSYGPFEVRVGLNSEGMLNAQAGWEHVHKSDSGLGATQISFKGITVGGNWALAFIEQRVDEASQMAENGKAKLVSEDDVAMMQQAYEAEANDARLRFMTQLKTNAPELEAIAQEEIDVIFKRLLSGCHPYDLQSGRERHIARCLRNPGSQIEHVWDKALGAPLTSSISSFAPRSYLSIAKCEPPTLRHFSAAPNSAAAMGREVGREVLDLGPEEVAELRRKIFEAASK